MKSRQQQSLQGSTRVVAASNIRIGDSVILSDQDDPCNTYPRGSDGLPHIKNSDVLGLTTRGIIKVVDPGRREYSCVDNAPIEPAGYEYVPIPVGWNERQYVSIET